MLFLLCPYYVALECYGRALTTKGANGDVPDFAHFNTTSTCKKRHVPNSTEVKENGITVQRATTNSVAPASWGLPWDEREDSLRNALASNPNATVTRLYAR